MWTRSCSHTRTWITAAHSPHTFSAHADQADLMWFMKSLEPSPRKIFLVHGDPSDRAALKEHLKAEGITRVECPEYGDEFELE